MDANTTLCLLKDYLDNNPNCKYIDLKNNNASLAYNVDKNGGFLKLKKELGYDTKERKSPNYWNLANLEIEISRISKNNIFPTVHQIKNALGNGAHKAILRYGGMKKVATLFGYSGSWFIATDGHYVQSSYEHIVDDILYHNNIQHDVNGLIPGTKYRYDFKTCGYYIEIWGYKPSCLLYTSDAADE